MTGPASETQISELVAKYSPEVAAQLREARDRLRAHFPRGFELVFDNYNALVFAISPTGKTSEAFISVAGYPNWVTLFFSAWHEAARSARPARRQRQTSPKHSTGNCCHASPRRRSGHWSRRRFALIDGRYKLRRCSPPSSSPWRPRKGRGVQRLAQKSESKHASLVATSAVSRSARSGRAMARSAAGTSRPAWKDPRLQTSSATRALCLARLAAARDQLLSGFDIRRGRAARLRIRPQQDRAGARGAPHIRDRRTAPATSGSTCSANSRLAAPCCTNSGESFRRRPSPIVSRATEDPSRHGNGRRRQSASRSRALSPSRRRRRSWPLRSRDSAGLRPA